MADVFISYARADRDRIEKLAAALESEGFTVWWDRHIDAGAEFSADIERELDAAKAVIVCWSQDGSKSPWVKDEAGIAASAGKLVAVTLDDGLPPIGYRQYHAAPMAAWKGASDDQVFRDLVRSLSAKISGEAKSAASKVQSVRKTPVPIPILLGATLALLAGGVLFWTFTRDAPAAAVEDVASIAADRIKSIAVLPFRDLSPGGDQQWFSDGLAEEITTTIARAPDIYVTPAAEAFSFRDSSARATTIARNLNVAHILSGSVRRSEQQMRITVELIRADDGEQIWSQSYDRQTSDAITVQEDIALEVAQLLDTALDPEALAEMVSAGTRSIDAYEAYLRGLTTESSIGRGWTQRALDQFALASERDPNFIAPRLAMVSMLQYRMSFDTYGWSGLDQALADAQPFNEQIDRILELTADRNDKQATDIAEEALAYRDIYELRFASAAKRYEKLARENPKNRDYWYGLVMNSEAIGDLETARAALRRYAGLPGSEDGWTLARFRRLGLQEEGREYALAAINNRADSFAVFRAGELLSETGDIDAVREALQLLRDRDYFDRNKDILRVRIACAEGRYDVLRDIAESDSRADDLARQYLGEKPPASEGMSALERSEPPYVLIGWGYSPEFDTTDLPITRAVLDKAGLPHDQPGLSELKCAPEKEMARD